MFSVPVKADESIISNINQSHFDTQHSHPNDKEVLWGTVDSDTTSLILENYIIYLCGGNIFLSQSDSDLYTLLDNATHPISAHLTIRRGTSFFQLK